MEINYRRGQEKNLKTHMSDPRDASNKRTQETLQLKSTALAIFRKESRFMHHAQFILWLNY